MSSWCKKCGNQIRWVRSASSQEFIALEIGPDPRGRILVQKTRDYATGKEHMVATHLSEHDAEEVAARGEKLWMAHNAMCSQNFVPGPIPPSILRRVERYRGKKGAA